MDHAELRAQGLKDHDAKKRHHMGGDALPNQRTEAMIREAINEHDDQQHGGKKTRLNFKRGGSVQGEESRERLDRARGGRTKKSGHTQVNVIIPQGGDHSAAAAPPMAAAPQMMPAPHPPMMPPPGAGGPPGMGPPVGAGVPMPHKRGGRVAKAYGGGLGMVQGDGGIAMPPTTGSPVMPPHQMPIQGGGGAAAPIMPQGGGAAMPPMRMPPQGGGQVLANGGPGPQGGGAAMAPLLGSRMGGMAPQGPGQQIAPMGAGLQGGAPGMGPMPPTVGSPPMGQPPMMGRPPMMGGMPPGAIQGRQFKRGGRAKDDAGAGSGLGRLEKIKDYGSQKVGERESESFAEDAENKDNAMRRGGRAGRK